MTTLSDLLGGLIRFNLPLAGIDYVSASYAMVSRYPNGYLSATVRYPSAVTKKVITCESRSLEYAFILTLHIDPDFFFVLEQPPKLTPTDALGEPFGYTPDFLVFWKNRPPTLFETKPSSQVATNALRHPGRYREVSPGRYSLPPAETTAATLGFTFRVFTEHNLEPVFLANTQMLEPFRRWAVKPEITDEEIKPILDLIAQRPGMKLNEVEIDGLTPARRADVIYALIAKGRIFTHLSSEPLQNQNRVALFIEPLRERAFATFHAQTAISPVPACAFPYELERGVKISLQKRVFTVDEVKGDWVTLRATDGTTSKLSILMLLRLLPAIDAIHGARLSMAERMRTLNDRSLADFLRRLELITPYLPGGDPSDKPAKNRTIRRYINQYEIAKSQFGIGEYGLIPRFDDRGNYDSTIPTDILNILDRFISKHFLHAHPRLSARKLHYRLTSFLERLKKTHIPSYRTVARHCKEWDKNYCDLKRYGKRFAAGTKVPFSGKSPMGSPHGVRPWDVGHCDHTENDLALDHPDATKRILKPHHSKLVDAVDGRVLAWVTRLEKPSTTTIILLLLDCVRRHGSLPAQIVVDWGPDFRGEWLQKTLSLLQITLTYRKKGDGQSGSPIETNFSMTDKRFIHGLIGSTEIMKHARKVSANVLPNKHSLWTLSDLVEQYEIFYKTYNETPDPVSKVSPNGLSENLSRYLGNHPRKCFSEVMLHRTLLPFADGIKRKVSPRCTIYVNGAYYASDKLGHLRGQYVDVRVDPDPRIVFASHPTLKELVECATTRSDLKYSQDIHQAVETVAIASAPAPQIKATMDENWRAFEDTIEAKETELKRKKRKRSKAPRSPAVAETNPPDNVVRFRPSQGGMVRLNTGGASS